MTFMPTSVAIIDPVGSKAGLDHYDLSLLNQLKEMGCDTLLFSNFQSDYGKAYFDHREKHSVLSVVSLFRKYRRVIKECRKRRVKNIIFHVFHFNRMDEWVLRKASDSGFNVVLIIHDVESFIYSSSKSRIQKICRYAGHLVVHNEFTKNELLKILGENGPVIINQIPHGNFSVLAKEKIPQNEARKRLSFPVDQPVILFFGMIKPSKGLDVFLEALPLINGSVRSVVAGRMRGHDFHPYEKIIQRTSMQDKIDLRIRFIPNDERNLLFSAADVIVLPYRKIYQSGVLLMAMSYGLPVVASNLPAMREIIRDGENGILFRDGQPQELADKINLLLSSPELPEKLKLQAMKDCEEKYNWKMIADSFYSLLS